jgi:DNA-binding winged helix-turn-helix (wHTH) protein
VYQFGDFRLDCGRFELTRNGKSLSVERKPLELLILLAETQGPVGHGGRDCGKAVESRSLCRYGARHQHRDSEDRHTLRDDSDEPRFVLTVMGKGYRFVAPVAIQGGVDGEPTRSNIDTGLPGNRPAVAEPTQIA